MENNDVNAIILLELDNVMMHRFVKENKTLFTSGIIFYNCRTLQNCQNIKFQFNNSLLLKLKLFLLYYKQINCLYQIVILRYSLIFIPTFR